MPGLWKGSTQGTELAALTGGEAKLPAFFALTIGVGSSRKAVRSACGHTARVLRARPRRAGIRVANGMSLVLRGPAFSEGATRANTAKVARGWGANKRGSVLVRAAAEGPHGSPGRHPSMKTDRAARSRHV